MNEWMQPFKKAGKLTDIDVHLLKGIYAKDPNDAPNQVPVNIFGDSEDYSELSMPKSIEL